MGNCYSGIAGCDPDTGESGQGRAGQGPVKSDEGLLLTGVAFEVAMENPVWPSPPPPHRAFSIQS